MAGLNRVVGFVAPAVTGGACVRPPLALSLLLAVTLKSLVFRNLQTGGLTLSC